MKVEGEERWDIFNCLIISRYLEIRFTSIGDIFQLSLERKVMEGFLTA